MSELENKIAIVTGAAGGIGAATARLFVDEGASVMLVDRDEAALAEVATSLPAARVGMVTADVSRVEDTKRYVQATIDRFGGLDILFANAGTEGEVHPLAEYPVDAFDRLIAVNVRGPFLGLQFAVPHLVERGGGSIVMTSSVAGLIGSAGLGPYVASKHALLGMMKTAAIELAPHRIRVNALNPGPIENRMMRSIEELAAPGHGEDVKAGFLSMVPMRRYGTNEEMARIALFLASERSSYCTGSTFVGDGGFTAG